MSQWTVSTRSGNPAPINKIPYVSLQRTHVNMPSPQKEGIRVWNLMVTTLRDNNLMEDKGES